MNTDQPVSLARQGAINGLAMVGFVALVVAGIWLAIYSTRFVPTVVNRAGGAAVYLGSLFTPAEEPTLSVVPTPIASTTISFAEASSTIATSASSTASTVVPVPAKKTLPKAVPTAGAQKTDTVQIAGTSTPPALSGLPDLVANISAIGYLATTSAESFIASSTVPAGTRPAVRFTIKNVGTNTAGPWRFSASIPTQTAYIYQSPIQQPLNPGDSIDYTLGFDQPIAGSDKMISVTANFDHALGESNTNNNSASAQLTILGN